MIGILSDATLQNTESPTQTFSLKFYENNFFQKLSGRHLCSLYSYRPVVYYSLNKLIQRHFTGHAPIKTPENVNSSLCGGGGIPYCKVLGM